MWLLSDVCFENCAQSSYPLTPKSIRLRKRMLAQTQRPKKRDDDE